MYSERYSFYVKREKELWKDVFAVPVRASNLGDGKILSAAFLFDKAKCLYICGRLSEVEEGAGSPLLLFVTIESMMERDVVRQLVEEKLASTENYLVDVMVKPGNVVVIEIDNDGGVCIDDCAELSRYLEEHLDREVEDFELEVGSAGVTAPFKVLRQYKKNIGREVEMLLKSGVKLVGVLKDADESGVVIAVETKVKPEGAKRKVMIVEERRYTFEEIKYTKYLINFK